MDSSLEDRWSRFKHNLILYKREEKVYKLKTKINKTMDRRGKQNTTN
jgi:hypothetical protein